jgi:hypothetical protein
MKSKRPEHSGSFFDQHSRMGHSFSKSLSQSLSFKSSP